MHVVRSFHSLQLHKMGLRNASLIPERLYFRRLAEVPAAFPRLFLHRIQLLVRSVVPNAIVSMKKFISRIVQRLFPGLWARYVRWKRKKEFGGKPVKDVFTSIYERNLWGDSTSISGAGSNDEQTRHLREMLPEILKKYSVRSLLDIPCGDFYWMAQTHLPIDEYTGGDIVKDLIEKNIQKYGGPGKKFLSLDLLQDPLPKADLIFCRDCLVHLSYDHIWLALSNVARSEATYFLTTVFPTRENIDITTGNWRPLNLMKAPFGLPKPAEVFLERVPENSEFQDKSLALYRISDIREYLSKKGK